MFEAIKHPVIRLKRVEFGPIRLNGVPRGKYRHLTQDEIKELREAALQTHKVQKGQ
jgi:23S rRNA pseudouridine2605 synthase